MKIVKTILKYLMYGFFLFMVTGFMAAMIKNSDNSDNAKKIFDDTRNFAKQPTNNTNTTYVPKTKPYKKNQSSCAKEKDRADNYSLEANKFNLDSAASACQMSKNLDQVISFMNVLKQKECSEFDEVTFNTYTNLYKMATTKCRQ